MRREITRETHQNQKPQRAEKKKRGHLSAVIGVKYFTVSVEVFPERTNWGRRRLRRKMRH